MDLEIDSEADQVGAPNPGLSVKTGPSRIPPAAHGVEADAMEAEAAAAAETSSEETGEDSGGVKNGGKRKRLEGRRGGGRSRGPAAQHDGVPTYKGAPSREIAQCVHSIVSEMHP